MEFKKEFKCSCGRTHTCDIDHVVICSGAVNEIGRITTEYKHILIVADKNTYPLCGDKVKSLLNGKNIDVFVYEDEGILVPNEAAIEKMSNAVTDTTDLIIGIGSGVIQDLCKYVSFSKNLPYYIIATAPSMDGYASVGSALIIENMKVTYNARVPKAIICDTDILKDAPMDMIRSGYGDILGKFSCLNDWKLSHVVNDEYYCDYIADMTYEMLNNTKDLGAALQNREPKAIQTLTEALIGAGIAMAYSGNSRPASGSEHHMAHYFEIVGIVKDEPYFSHGTDVAYSAVYTQKLREKLLKIDMPGEKSNHTTEKWEENIRRIYASAADGVIALQNKLGWYNVERNAVYRKKWAEIKAVLADTPSSDELIAYLDSVGLDIADYEKEYGEEKINDALFYAKDLKDRYSVLWMYYDCEI